LAGQRIRVNALSTIGEVISEHRKIYCLLRKGRIEPKMANRLSQMLVNHRSMLELGLLEAELQNTKLQLENLRQEAVLINHVPLRSIAKN